MSVFLNLELQREKLEKNRTRLIQDTEVGTENLFEVGKGFQVYKISVSEVQNSSQ